MSFFYKMVTLDIISHSLKNLKLRLLNEAEFLVLLLAVNDPSHGLPSTMPGCCASQGRGGGKMGCEPSGEADWETQESRIQSKPQASLPLTL